MGGRLRRNFYGMIRAEFFRAQVAEREEERAQQRMEYPDDAHPLSCRMQHASQPDNPFSFFPRTYQPVILIFPSNNLMPAGSAPIFMPLQGTRR